MRKPARGTRGERVYRILLHLYPPDFRRRFGDQMLDCFRDRRLESVRRGGLAGSISLWLRTLADLGASASAEWIAPRPATPATQNLPRRTEMLPSLIADLRFTGRMLRKHPAFTVVAVVVLALGIGAVSTIFSVANAVVLRPIPAVAEPERLVWIQRADARGEGSLSASYIYYESLAERSRTMSGVAAWTMAELTVSTGGVGVGALGNLVSGNFFQVLGAAPHLGRFFSDAETRVEGDAPVIVVSHGFWTRQLGSDSSVVGRTILVNGSRFTILGVAAPRFTGLFPVLRTDVWVPVSMHGALRPNVGGLRNPGSAWLELFGRIRVGVTADAAQAELQALTTQFAAGAGEPRGMASYVGARLKPVTGLPADASGPVAGFLGLLLAVAGLVLLIASVNVASMLLARAVARRREIAVRLALGAGRARLVRQLLTESIALFVLGGGAGVLVAVAGTRLLERIDLPVDVPMNVQLTPDARVLAFTLLVALVTGVAFGLAPAMQASKLDLNVSLRGDTAGSGRSRSRMRNALVVGQVALSMVLLTAAGLFTRALDRGRSVQIGFDPSNVAVATMNVETAGYDEPRARVLYASLAERVGARPGVERVTYTRIIPLSMSSSGRSISVPGYTPPGNEPGAEFPVSNASVGAGYFETLRMPLVRGRGFVAGDRAGAPRVAVVNETFVRRYWPDRDPLGRSFVLDGEPVTVVGVSKDGKYSKLNEELAPFVYFPLEQLWSSGVSLLARTTGDPATLGSVIREELRALDPNLPPPVTTTLSRATAVALLPQRVAAGVTAALGLAGLLLAAVGLYGVIAFSAAQRTREMGIRLALGARPRDVRRMVVGEGMRLVGVGVGIGIVLAAAGTRVLTPFLFGVSPVDPLTFVTIALSLGATAMLASYLPARRAAAADPVISLRSE